MHRDNWDDLRFVLAVAQNGSVSAASRVLGVNHATVLRRIASFEERHGTVIFDKTPRGYAISADRQRVIDAAEDVEAAILTVARLIEGVQAPLSGRVRVTSTDTFCHTVLPPVIAALHDQAADLHVDLICSNLRLDLARLDADVAIRPAVKLPDNLRGDIGGMLAFGIYGAPGGSDCWLGVTGALVASTVAQWLDTHAAPERIVATADSFITLREMAAAGLGRAILPRILARGDTRLREVAGVAPPDDVPIWVASHADLADVPRIRAVRQHFLERLRAMPGILAGPR